MDLIRMFLIAVIVILSMFGCEQEGEKVSPSEAAIEDPSSPENPDNFIEDEETGELVEKEFSAKFYFTCGGCDIIIQHANGETEHIDVPEGRDDESSYMTVTGYKMSVSEMVCFSAHVDLAHANQGIWYRMELYSDDFVEPAVRDITSSNGGSRCLNLTTDLSYYEMYDAMF